MRSRPPGSYGRGRRARWGEPRVGVERGDQRLLAMRAAFGMDWGDLRPFTKDPIGDLEAGRLTHFDQEPLNDAREGARKRNIGKAGGWGYVQSDPSVNIAPLVAITLARVAATINEKPVSTTPAPISFLYPERISS